MVDCKTCELEKLCDMPEFVKNDLKKCATYTQKKPQTNADRIRSMSDEELAEFLIGFDVCDLCKLEVDECFKTTDCEKRSVKVTVEWLKSEAKE